MRKRARVCFLSLPLSAPWPVMAAEAPPGAPITDPALITAVEGSEQGFVIFQERCTACHGNEAVEQAPSPQQLRQLPAQRIHEALTVGAMQAHAEGLSEADVRRVAESLSGQLLTELQAGAEFMPNPCQQTPPLSVEGSAWPQWGQSPDNRRHQRPEHSALQPTDLASLEVTWAFGFPGGSSAYGEPVVAGDWLFVGSDNGHLYALGARDGCVHWSFQAQAGVRNSPVLAQVDRGQGVRPALLFGDMKAQLYAVDAEDGELLWQVSADEHVAARMTASPAYHDGVLYVAMSAWEEGAGRAESYPCCTFRGSVAAYDIHSGERLWKTHTITETPTPTRRNRAGVQLYAPAGGAVWNTPVLDPVRRQVYVGTGNAYTAPAPETTDAVLALDMDSGALLWHYQTQADDAFLVGCGAVDSDNCPEPLGPDNDIPASLILHRDPAGETRLIAATRRQAIIALSPQGQRLWQQSIPGNVMWGGSADALSVYYGLSGGGMVALDVRDGQQRWQAELGVGPNGAVVSSMAGVAFVGGISGMLSAVSTDTGEVFWQFPTAQDFDTVNDIPARGGSISAAGVVIAGERLYVPSGYQVIYGQPGNVLLAFGKKNSDNTSQGGQ